MFHSIICLGLIFSYSCECNSNCLDGIWCLFHFPWTFQHLCMVLDLWTYNGVALMKIYSENLWVGIPRIMFKKEIHLRDLQMDHWNIQVILLLLLLFFFFLFLFFVSFLFCLKNSVKKYYPSLETASLWVCYYSVTHSSEQDILFLMWYSVIGNRYLSSQRWIKTYAYMQTYVTICVFVMLP